MGAFGTYDLTTYPMQFVDSVAGTAAAGKVKNLVPVAVNRRYHKKVQTKTFFQKVGMIGPDNFQEGNVTQTAPGYPVIRKDDLSGQPGDTIRVGILNNLSAAVSTGKVGNAQLVDYEPSADFDDLQVKVMNWRQAVKNTGGSMDVQRNPFGSLEQIEMDLLSDWHAQILDTSILYALHYRWSPNVLREHGTTSCPIAAVTNSLFGNDMTMDTTRTIADMQGGGTDNISADTLDIAATYMQQNNIDPIMVNGQPFWVALVSPKAMLILRRDSKLREAFLHAATKGTENPLFRYSEIIYGNVICFSYDKVRSIIGGYNPAGLSVAGPPGAITEAALTGIGGGLAYTDLHQTYFLGANALALAEGQLKMAGRIRKEDDYQQIIGRGIEGIFGVRRADWLEPAGSTYTNQSALRIVNSLVVA